MINQSKFDSYTIHQSFLSKFLLIFPSFFLILGFGLLAQAPLAQASVKPQGTGSVSGKVVDKQSQSPMEYANVVLYSLKDSSMVSGGITNQKGEFLLKDIPFGKYYMKLIFLGYYEQEIPSIQVNPRQPDVILSLVELLPDAQSIDEVEISAERSEVLFRLDKKIVTVGSNLNSSGGSAIDALENTPSVSVDVEGNVSLRGSSNFRVLIDGKPSPFSGSDALEMIPVSTIDRIEIITNPSAKYDPEGTAGIINVITKANSMDGVSALINTNTDTQGSYGGDFIVNINQGKANFFLGGNYDQRVNIGKFERESRNFIGDTTFFTKGIGDRKGIRDSRGIRIGLDYKFSVSDDFSAVLSYGQRLSDRNHYTNYQEWTIPGSDSLESRSVALNSRSNENVQLNMDYKHRFDSEGHEISATLSTSMGAGKDIAGSEQNALVSDAMINTILNTEEGTDEEFRFNIDYIRPFGNKMKFETGYQSWLEWQNEVFAVEFKGPTGDFILDSTLDSRYRRNIQSIYTMFSHELNKFSYQLGLRGEFTDRDMLNQNSNASFGINRFDLFPSIHVSYQLPADQQIQASYSRRIQRPSNYHLEPFMTYRDAFTIWQGNPTLLPELADSYELSYQKKINTSFISFDLFHRTNHDLMQRVRRVYNENTILMTMDNVGKDYSTGAELMVNMNLNPWWNFNLSGSGFHYLIDSELIHNYNESFNWNARTRQTFRLAKNVRFQLDGYYVSNSVTAQGESIGFFMLGSALRMNFLDNRLSLTLQMRDILFSAKWEFIDIQENFYSHVIFRRNGQVLQLNLSYKLNNFKEKKKSQENGDFGGDVDF